MADSAFEIGDWVQNKRSKKYGLMKSWSQGKGRSDRINVKTTIMYRWDGHPTRYYPVDATWVVSNCRVVHVGRVPLYVLNPLNKFIQMYQRK